jgi:hypothetical protein
LLLVDHVPQRVVRHRQRLDGGTERRKLVVDCIGDRGGRVSRIAIIGARLCPPAISLAPSPHCRSSSQVSATERART